MVGATSASASTIQRDLIAEISRCHSATTLHKKRAGHQALLEKLCRPYFPAKFRFDLAGGTTLLAARQGSSRDLDHQALALSPSL
jgi:hypothetical protein